MPVKLKKEEVFKIIESEDYEVQSSEYVNNRTDLSIKHLKCDNIFSMNFDHWKQGQRCPKCNKESQKKTPDQFREELEKNVPGKYTLLEEYTNKNTKIKVICNECNNIMSIIPKGLLQGNCAHCGKIQNKITAIEYSKDNSKKKELFEFVKTLDPHIEYYKLQISDNKFIELECYSKEYNIGVEFDYLQSTDNLSSKTDICSEYGIRLIHIFEDEWDNKKEIVKDKLKSIFGKIDNKIYARKCVVKEISSKDKNEFLNKNHIQGGDNSKIKLGLFNDNELVSVMTFTKPRANMGNRNVKEGEYELIRYAGKLDHVIVGGFSKLLKYAEENYDIKKIITYADIRYSKLDSNVYQNNGFVFSHRSQNNYYYLNNNMLRLDRFNFRKSKLKDLFPEIYSDDKSESEIMKEAGYHKIYDCGNLVYIKEVKGE